MMLGISSGGARNTTVKPWIASWDEVTETLSSPEVGPKDGSYFTLPTFSDHHRHDESVQFPLQGFVLDGDSTIDLTTGELREGAPPPEYVHEALVELDINHLIYSSYSHGVKGNRYRVLVAVEIRDADEHRACVDWMIDQLHQKQVMIANVTENHTISLPWYLPRISAEGAPFYFAEYNESDIPLTADEALSWYREFQQNVEIIAANQSFLPRGLDPNSPIDCYCMNHGIAEVMEMLQKHGYLFMRTSMVNNHTSYHLIAPESSSGSAGVNVWIGRDNGKVLVCSHHGDHDPLIKQENGKRAAIDAFEVFVRLEHKGDRKAAVEAAKGMMPKPEQSPFKLSPINELLKQPPPFEWLIRGWLQPRSEVMVIGESTVGKSFVMLDMALCIATGKAWNYCKTKQAPVVYITGEGYTGFRLRVKAWELEFGDLDDAPLVLSEQPADFMDEDNLESVDKAVGAFAADHDGKVGVVIVDTMIRNMVGDENSADDFALFSRNLQQLCRKYGATSIVVHHPGHGDKSRGRGSSAQKGNQDTLLLLSFKGDSRVMECDKMKDGAEPPKPIGFELKQVELPWKDSEGENLTSCVVEWGSAPEHGGKKMPAGVKLGLTTLISINHGEGVPLEEWREIFYSQHTGDTTSTKKQAFFRVRKELVAKGVVSVLDDVYSITGETSAWVDVLAYVGTAKLTSNFPEAA